MNVITCTLDEGGLVPRVGDHLVLETRDGTRVGATVTRVGEGDTARTIAAGGSAGVGGSVRRPDEAVGDDVFSSADARGRVHASARSVLASVDVIDTEIRTLENRLNAVGDDAQLANVDLQSELQKQQEALQMLSNISRQLHDANMTIIRKIG